jgi:hypothetical protein
MTGQKATAVGVPYDDGPAGFEKSDQVYGEIERGDYDAILDQLEKMIRGRLQWERRRPGARSAVPKGMDLETADLLAQVQHGYFGRHTSMLAEAVRIRKVHQKNAALTATLDRLKANPPTLAEGDRVQVNPDAPLKQKWTVLLGRTATVTGKPSRGKVPIRFDDGQPLGPLTNPATKMDAWMLEPLADVLDPDTIKAVWAKWNEVGGEHASLEDLRDVFGAWLQSQIT